MGLQDKLNAYKEGFKTKAPQEAQAIMQQATEELSRSGILDRAIAVGDPAPPFELENTEGQMARLDDLIARGPLVLTFYRGKWWPYCNLELEALEATAEKFRSLGAELVAISPQKREYSQAMKQEKDLSLEILSDPGNMAARQYGLVYTLPDDLTGIYRSFGIDLPNSNGDDSWSLPMPARLIIDGQGKVRYAAINADYTVRPEPEHTLEALRKIVNR